MVGLHNTTPAFTHSAGSSEGTRTLRQLSKACQSLVLPPLWEKNHCFSKYTESRLSTAQSNLVDTCAHASLLQHLWLLHHIVEMITASGWSSAQPMFAANPALLT